MSSDDGDGDDGGDGPGRREVAHRLFAAEFDDVTVSYRESDEERAPNYVVTPTGARVNRLFAVGVLTEVESVNEDVVRARLADPTGAFVSYAGQYQPEALAFYERTDPPAFVALTGKARTFEPEDGDRIYSSVRPETVNEVDADTRDRWVVDAAVATLDRVRVMRDALDREERGEDLRAVLETAGVGQSLAAGVPVAIDRYDTTRAYLDAVRELALDALAVVSGDRDEARPLDLAPDEGDPNATVGALPGGDESAVAAVETVESATVEADEARAPTAGGGESAPDDDPGATGGDDDLGDFDGGTPSGEAGTAASVDEDAGTAGGSDEANADDEPDESGTGPGGEPAHAEPADPETADVDLDDPDDVLGDDQRAELEEEFDTEFATGSEVDEPGEADIDVPDPESVEAEAADDGGEATAEAPDSEGTAAEPEPESGDDAGASPDAESGADGDAGGPSDDAGDETDDTGDTGDVDLEDAVVEAMTDLDDGDGADREAVVAAVVDEHGADPEDVETAVQDALMSGRCYEPDGETLKPI